MKVEIGPYKDYVSSYKYTKRLEKYLKESTVDKIDNTLQSILNFFWNNRKNSKRKVKVQIENFDTWNLDHTLSLIILPLLIQLKETKHGSPHVYLSDLPKSLRKNDVHAQWNWIIDEIIWSFDQVAHDLPGEEQFIIETDSQDPLVKYKIDIKEYRKYHKKLQNGFRLFGKYYQNLWD